MVRAWLHPLAIFENAEKVGRPQRRYEIDAKTLSPDRFQYSQFQLPTPYSGFDDTR